MEREHKNQEPAMFLEIQGVKVELTPSNTAAYVHEEEPQFDHLFYASDGGYLRVYRQVLHNFDDVVAFMEGNDYEVVYDVFAQPKEKEAYFETYGYPELPTREITQREERKLKFAKYLMDNMTTVEDLF